MGLNFEIEIPLSNDIVEELAELIIELLRMVVRSVLHPCQKQPCRFGNIAGISDRVSALCWVPGQTVN
jgi:hypothetical protein